MIQKTLIHTRFSSKFGSYNEHAVVQQNIASRLASLLHPYLNLPCTNLLEFGAGTGFLTKAVLQNAVITNYYLNDLVASSLAEVKSNTGRSDFHFFVGDAEQIPLPSNLDVIISSSTFQWFEDIQSFFRKITTILNSEGLFAFASFGPQNFMEIKSTLGVGLHYKSLNELEAFLLNDFDILYANESLEEMCFDSPNQVLRHIKQTGVNGLSAPKLTKSSLCEFEQKYCALFLNKEKMVKLTYHPIIIIAKKKKDGRN